MKSKFDNLRDNIGTLLATPRWTSDKMRLLVIEVEKCLCDSIEKYVRNFNTSGRFSVVVDTRLRDAVNLFGVSETKSEALRNLKIIENINDELSEHHG